MSTIERREDARMPLRRWILGRILPHTLIVAYLIYMASGGFGTVRMLTPVFALGYGGCVVSHTWMALKRIRFPITIASTVAGSLLIGVLTRLVVSGGETGAYVADILTWFLVALAWISAVNSTLFVRVRYWYVADVALVTGCWISQVVTTIEAPALSLMALSLPVLAYVLYVMMLDATTPGKLTRIERRKMALRFAAALVVVVAALLTGRMVGPGLGDTVPPPRTYSMLDAENNQFEVTDRAKLEPEMRLPLDSKELVFVAYIDPIHVGDQEYQIGYYLKFHSLLTYDPARMEFNTVSDEREDPNFRVRLVPLDATQEEPVQLTLAADGTKLVPPYAMRTEGRTTIYNIRLKTGQSFGPNLTYRFITYPATDSVTVGDNTHPVLGVHKLFTRVSLLNLIPIGSAGDLFQFDLNKEVLARVAASEDVARAPRSFLQPYLNTHGLEQDIIDTAKAVTRSSTTVAQKIEAVIRWFTRRRDDGRPLFVYDLKPGRPTTPGQSLLQYFLFENHRGYCTYYATASTLMLRAAGVPARVATGFVPGATSDANPGWYYVYSIQAHAWTEVYLGPSLGWMDLDLTPVGQNSDEPPPPNPTPPVPPMPIEPQLRLDAVVARAGEGLTVTHARITRRDEEADSVIHTADADAFALVYDRTFDSGQAARERHRTVTDVVRMLRAGDSVTVIGRQSVNPGLISSAPAGRTVHNNAGPGAEAVRSREGKTAAGGEDSTASDGGSAVQRFVFHTLMRQRRVAHDTIPPRNAAASAPSYWREPELYIGISGLILLILLSAPRTHLAVLARGIRAARDERRRLARTRAWILLTLQLHVGDSQHETDLEMCRRLGSSFGMDLTVFFEAYLAARYAGEAGGDRRAVCQRAMRAVVVALALRQGVMERMLRRTNVYAYVRHINRRKTV